MKAKSKCLQTTVHKSEHHFKMNKERLFDFQSKSVYHESQDHWNCSRTGENTKLMKAISESTKHKQSPLEVE